MKTLTFVSLKIMTEVLTETIRKSQVSRRRCKNRYNITFLKVSFVIKIIEILKNIMRLKRTETYAMGI